MVMSVKLQARLVACKTYSPTYPSGNHAGALQRRRGLDDSSTTARCAGDDSGEDGRMQAIVEEL
jgi:hypothetical protein